MTEEIQQRKIRSFVRREGRMTDGQKQALDELWPVYGLNREDGVLDLNTSFPSSQPVTLEIGFGNGDSLYTQAASSPDQNYLGIEVYRTGVARLLRSSAASGLGNIRCYCDDAVEVIDQCIPEACIDTVQLYFPDPWHKKRHHKRRIVRAAFADRIARILKPGGRWLLATDWQNYAEQMLEVLNNHPAFENLSTDKTYMPRPDERPHTRFEERGIKRGHGVWDLAFSKK